MKKSTAKLLGYKSVPKPSAQTATLSQDFSNKQTPGSFFMYSVLKNPELSRTDKAVIELMYLYGLRISEVLSIKSTDVSTIGHIKIRSKKGSNFRVITSLYFPSYWSLEFRLSLPLSDYYSRFYFYRLFKKMGYYQKLSGHNNFSVTHYFRHRLVTDLKSQGFSLQDIKDFLGHKSIKSTEYYYGKN